MRAAELRQYPVAFSGRPGYRRKHRSLDVRHLI